MFLCSRNSKMTIDLEVTYLRLWTSALVSIGSPSTCWSGIDQDHSSLCTGLVLNLYTLGQICKSWFLWQGTVPQPSASFGFKQRNEARGVYLKYENTINIHFEKILLRQGAQSRLICALLIPSGCEWAGRPQYCLFIRPISDPCGWLDVLLLSATSQSPREPWASTEQLNSDWPFSLQQGKTAPMPFTYAGWNVLHMGVRQAQQSYTMLA